MAESLPPQDSGAQDKNLKGFSLALFFGGLFLLAFGTGLFFFRSASGDDIQIISANGSEVFSEIIVHVDGAVNKPGVYSIGSDSRVADAIQAAGGLNGEADASRINLAAKLVDGQKVYIQKIGESVSQSVGGSAVRISGAQGQLVNINAASESELDKLPGIGPVTAQKIIASRPYSSVQDLLTRKVVSSSVFSKIKDLVTAN